MEKIKSKSKIFKIAFCGIMIALSITLSITTRFWQMPLGGDVNLCAMLPVMLIGYYLGTKYGLIACLAYSLLEMLLSIGSVLSWGLTPTVVVATVFIDYIFAYTALGLSGVIREAMSKKKTLSKGVDFATFILGMVLATFTRFVLHFISGVVLFDTWATFEPVWLYSIAYNGGYMLPNLVLCIIGGCLIYYPLNKAVKKMF